MSEESSNGLDVVRWTLLGSPLVVTNLDLFCHLCFINSYALEEPSTVGIESATGCAVQCGPRVRLAENELTQWDLGEALRVTFFAWK